jgi:hypothetical protein
MQMTLTRTESQRHDQEVSIGMKPMSALAPVFGLGLLLLLPVQTSAHAAGAQVDSADLDQAYVGDLKLRSQMEDKLTLLGSGYNSFSQEILGDCVHGTVVPPDPVGSSPSYSLRFLESYEEFRNETKAEASLATGFSGFSATVKSKFEQAGKSSSRTTFILVRERVPVTSLRMRNAKFIGPTTTDDSFYEQCGDQFVAEVEIGGEFMALLTASESESEAKTALGVSAEVSYASTTATAEFSQTMNSLKTNKNLQVDMERIGGSGDLPKSGIGAAGIDDLLAYAASFPEVARKAPVPLSVVAKSYVLIGFRLPPPTKQKEVFAALQKKLQDSDQAIELARYNQGVFNTFNIPPQLNQGDIVARTQQALDYAQKLHDKFVPAIARCASQFWVLGSCSVLGGVPYLPPKIIVRKLDVKSGTLVRIRWGDQSRAIFRGEYCYSGSDQSACLRDGIDRNNLGIWWAQDAGNIQYGGNNYKGGEIALRPGTDLLVRVVDEDYSDNQGDLYVILY